MLKLNKPINVKDLQMLLRTVNFDSISNSYKNLYIFSKTVICLIFFQIHYVHMGSNFASFFHSTSKIEFFYNSKNRFLSYLEIR